MPDWIKPEDGMKITRDAMLVPDVYYLPHGIEVGADGVTLDGNGHLPSAFDTLRVRLTGLL